MDKTEPLTKAKLFISHDSGPWMEMGIGVVSVTTEAAAVQQQNGAVAGGGKRGKADSSESNGALVGRLQVVSLDFSSDLLLTSIVSLNDIYTIQGESILVWYDESIGHDVACSFNSRDGCDLIYRQIIDYQQVERARLVQGERMPTAEVFAVLPSNLPRILEAAESQNKRLGIYIRDDTGYVSKLSQLFYASRETSNTATMDLVGRILLALLQSPYNSEGRIIAQFADNERIDEYIDIVQYALGRQDKASGFVSFDERRATFHDPCELPPSIISRVHVLYSCGFLRDLVPLSLEPADAASYSLLHTITLRFTMAMLKDLCGSPTILPRVFERAAQGVQLAAVDSDPASVDPQKVAHLFEVAAFVNEIAKTTKNAMVAVAQRREILTLLVDTGLIPFLTVVLECALRYYDPPSNHAVAEWLVSPSRAVQVVCDTLNACTTHFPECLEDLVVQAGSSAKRCLLGLLIQAITRVRSGAEAQSVVDVVQCCGVGVPLTVAMFGVNPQLEARRHDVVRFWIEGNVVDRPPLFHLCTSMVRILSEAATSSVGSSGVVLQVSVVQERQVIYGLRVLTAVLSKVDTTRCRSLIEVIELSGLVPALAEPLKQPARRLANLQSSITAFIAAVLDRRDGRLVRLVTSSQTNLLHCAMALFLLCSHRGNILSSALAHLLSAVCEGVHREKLNASSTLNTSGSLATSPFVTLLRGEDSISKTEPTSPEDAGAGQTFESVAAAVLAQFGDSLALAAPLLTGWLRTSLEETPEEAQLAEADTSSIASSMERTGLPSLGDFDVAAIDFGLEPPLRTLGLDAVTEERLSSLTHSLTTSEEDEGEFDEDSLKNISSIDSDEEEEQDPGEEVPVQAVVTEVKAAPRPSLRMPLVREAVMDSVDPPSGRCSLLEDEENRLPKRLSTKRGRDDIDTAKDEEEEEAEAKRLKAESEAA